MKRLLTPLVAMVTRNWLRVGLLLCGVMLLSQKEVNFSIRLGGDDGGPSSGLMSLFSFSSDEEASTVLLDRLAAHSDGEVAAFVKRFSHVAQAEQEKFGIPASIVLATGLLYSEAGRHPVVLSGNNYFGLPNKRYETAWASFRGFSEYVVRNDRYAGLDARDHRGWARAMETASFNGTPNLAAQLEAVIERYGLQRFD